MTNLGSLKMRGLDASTTQLKQNLPDSDETLKDIAKRSRTMHSDHSPATAGSAPDSTLNANAGANNGTENNEIKPTDEECAAPSIQPAPAEEDMPRRELGVSVRFLQVGL